MKGRDFFIKYKRLIYSVVGFVNLFPRFLVVMLWNFFLCFDGRAFAFVRYVLLHKMSASVGDNVFISASVYIRNPADISYGDNVSIHPMCYLDGYGGVCIGSNVSIAHASSLVSFEHQWEELSVPIKYNQVKSGSITIEDDVWIAAGVRVLAGTYIESRVVVAAGAVVKGRLESGWLYGGVPARKLKKL